MARTDVLISCLERKEVISTLPNAEKASSAFFPMSRVWEWRSKVLILKEINPESLLEGLMLKLKLQYFGHPIGRPDSLEKTLMLGKIEGRRKGDDRG